MTLDPPPVAFGDLVLGERGEEPSGRPAFLVGARRDLGPGLLDRGQAQVA